MMQKLLRPLELALLAVIGAVEWVIGWVERQSTPMKARVGDVVGYSCDNDRCRDLCKVAVMEPVVAYAVLTALNGGSELLIFVPRAAHSPAAIQRRRRNRWKYRSSNRMGPSSAISRMLRPLLGAVRRTE